ncbi:hypothetical protein [Phormidium pseudopriestleyi]|nr:hypothetical protein [Phormidium pseudopriestleyi]
MNIFAPNLYLCAYHLREDDTEGKTHPLWLNCDRLLSHFTDTRLIPHIHHSEHRILLPPPQKQISFTLPNFPDMEGFIQPVQLQEDSYGVFLNIGYDDSNPANTVAIPVLEQFNPNHILPFPPSPYFLGQTLLLTLNLTPENQGLKGAELTELANQCYQALLNQKADPSRSGELFGSPIFEYGNPGEPDKSPHVLIWLFRDKNADEMLGKCFQLTFDLFFYRHKVSKAFQDSRQIYKQLKQYYLSLDPILDQIQEKIDTANPDPQDTTYLQNLKTQLKQLSADSLNYDRLLRKMKDFGTTININLNNYNDTIERICAKLGTDKEELSFWRYFGEETGPYFRVQIAANLSYFEQGTGLISQAVASIRAIVEIDQAQCDRQRQQAEKDYYQKQQDDNQKLQNRIQAVGVGIAAGAIFASTSGLIPQPWYFPNGQKMELHFIPPHPFLIGLLGSIICSVGAWLAAEALINRGKKQIG